MPKLISERSRLHKTHSGATKPYKLHAKMNLGALGTTKPYAFRVGESALRYILACNLQGLVAPECVSCRRERSKVHFDPLFTMVFEVLGVKVNPRLT